MADPRPARQLEADLLADGRELLERRCASWRLRHLYPHGPDLSLLVSAWQELDRRRAIGMAGHSPRSDRRTLRTLVRQYVRRDALARSRRLAYGVPVARPEPIVVRPGLLDEAIARIDADVRPGIEASIAMPAEADAADGSTATAALAATRGLTQLREALLSLALAQPERMRQLPPQVIALMAAAQPEVRRHPIATLLLLKLPLQLLMIVVTLLNVAYIGAYYFFNDAVLGRFVSSKVSGLLQGELEIGSIHWHGDLIVDLVTGQPHHVVVEDVTVWEPYKDYGGERLEPAAHADRIEATLVLHEIIPWNRLGIPRVFEIPWILHFAEVDIQGDSYFDVRGYVAERDDGQLVRLVGLRDAFTLWRPLPPNQNRGLSFMVDAARSDKTTVDVDFREIAGWRFVHGFAEAAFALRFVAFDPDEPLPEALPFAYTIDGWGGQGELLVSDIDVPIDALDEFHGRGGVQDVPFGDVGFEAKAIAAGSEVHVRGELRQALARVVAPGAPPVPFGTPVVWGPAPIVSLIAQTADVGRVLAHVADRLGLPPYALAGDGAPATARIEGAVSDPQYHLAAEGLVIDALDEPAWTVDDAEVSLVLAQAAPPDRFAHHYLGRRLTATFDTLRGTALEGAIELVPGEAPAQVILPALEGEPYILTGTIATQAVNPGQLVPDDAAMARTLGGSATGTLTVHELRLGPVAPAPDADPDTPTVGLRRADLGFDGFVLHRDLGPADDNLPRTLRASGRVVIDETGAIDWSGLAIATDGARLATTGGIDGALATLDNTSIAVDIDDGAAFARAFGLPSYIDTAHAKMVLFGATRRPSGRDGRLILTTAQGALSGPTEIGMRLEGGVLRLRADDAHLLGGRGRIEVDVTLFDRRGLRDDPLVRASAALRGVDLGALSQGRVAGIADVELEVGDGQGGAAPISELRVSGTAVADRLRFAGTTYRDASIAFRWREDELAIERLVLPLYRATSLVGGERTEIEVGRIVADGSVGLAHDPALDLHVAAEGIPLAVVADLLAIEAPVRGQIDAGTRLDVGGTLSRPSVDGKVALSGLAGLGIPLGSGQLDVTSEDAPAGGGLAAHRELRARGELATGSRGDGAIDWSVDAVVAIGKPAPRSAGPQVAAQVDVTFERLAVPLLLRATGTTLAGIQGELEGLAAHVLTCNAGTPMLSDCATGSDAPALSIKLSLDRAWLRAVPKTSTAKTLAERTSDPCRVVGTLCADAVAATLDGTMIVLDRPLRLRSSDGTDAQLSGTFDLSPAPKLAAKAAPASCRAPPPPPPRVAAPPEPAPAPTGEAGHAVLTGAVALQSVRALLAPYGLEAAKGRIQLDLALDGPVAAPTLGGRLDLPAEDRGLVVDVAGVPFPVEFTDLAISIHEGWIATRGVVRVLGEDLAFGSVDGDRTGIAYAGPCAGAFDIAATGTVGSRLIARLVGDTSGSTTGGIDVRKAAASGRVTPELAIDRAEGTFGFFDHDLQLDLGEGLDDMTLREGRFDLRRCSAANPCRSSTEIPDGSIALTIGGSARGTTTAPREAVRAEIGARGQATLWGRAFFEAGTLRPMHTEIDAVVEDVAYRDYDARGQLVAEAELTSPRISLRGAEPIVVQGDVEISRGRYVKDAIQGVDILAFTEKVPLDERPPPALVRELQFDISAQTDDPLRIENNIASGVEANVSVDVTGTYDALELAGRIDLESGGKVDLPFLSGTYAIQRGRVNLLGAVEDAEVDILAAREEPIYVDAQPQQLRLLLGGTLSSITWQCSTDADKLSSAQNQRSCFDYLVLGTGDVQVSDADVKRFGGGGVSEARKPLQVVGHVTELDVDERVVTSVPRLRGYVPDVRLRLGQIGPELQVDTPANWFDFDYGQLQFGWDYVRGYPGFFLRQSRQLTARLKILDPITLEFSRRIRSYLNQRVVFDPPNQRTLELRFDVEIPSAR